jgi:DNA polymerase-1
VGKKTAVRLINRFKSVDNLLANVDRISNIRLKARIKQSIENIELSRDLAKIRMDVPLDIEIEQMRVKPYDKKALEDIFNELDFNKNLLKIYLKEDRGQTTAPRNKSHA